MTKYHLVTIFLPCSEVVTISDTYCINIKLTTFDHEVHKVLALPVDIGAFFDVALHVGAFGCWA